MSEGPWYAADPASLDPAARRSLTAWARTRQTPSAGDTARTLEAMVARDPARAFAFDASGCATLQVGERVHAAGRFTLPTIGDLRTAGGGGSSRARLSVLHGADVLTDIATLQATAPAGVLFQVASQFNCLEAPSARVVPVSAYVSDPTQGPRASIGALPGTLLRHHAAPGADGERFVQSSARCLDLLGDVLLPSVAEVRSGYLETRGVHDAAAMAAALTDGFDRIRVGVHDEIEVLFGHDWDGPVARPGARIAQVFTSTMALGMYGKDDGSPALAMVLQQLLRAAYVGTLLGAASLGKHTVVLTLIGGGVFGNPHPAIWSAILHALGEVDAAFGDPLHVIVNTREGLPREAEQEVRERGGFVARFSPGEVAIGLWS